MCRGSSPEFGIPQCQTCQRRAMASQRRQVTVDLQRFGGRPHTPQCTHDTEHTQGVCACVWVVCGVGVRCAHADPQISEGGCALRHSELDRAFASGHPLSQQAGITLLRYSARLIQRGRSGSTSSNTPQIIISIANGLSISYALALRAPVGSSS